MAQQEIVRIAYALWSNAITPTQAREQCDGDEDTLARVHEAMSSFAWKDKSGEWVRRVR